MLKLSHFVSEIHSLLTDIRICSDVDISLVKVKCLYVSFSIKLYYVIVCNSSITFTIGSIGRKIFRYWF